MTNELRRTFCDIDIILNELPEEDRNKVPMKFRVLISENKLEAYESDIRTDIPIEDQELHPDTQTFLAMLYLYYWCKDEEEKRELKKLFTENEEISKKEIEEKFEVFKENNNQESDTTSFENQSEQVITENVVEPQNNEMVVYKESIIKKIINKVLSFFRRK